MSTKRFPQRLDLCRRRDIQFPAQNVATSLILIPGEPKPAAVAVQADDGGVDILLKRIKGQGPLGNLDGAVCISRCGAQPNKRFQAGQRQFPQSLAFKQKRDRESASSRSISAR